MWPFTSWSTERPSQRLDRDSTLFDAFGNLRVCSPKTIFDSKLTIGKLPMYWDEVTIGDATSSCSGGFAVRQLV